MEIFNKLKEVRKQKGLTRLDMLKKINSEKFRVGYDALCRYERGDSKVPGYIIDKYCDILGYELKLQMK